jgi:hypothetical protein
MGDAVKLDRHAFLDEGEFEVRGALSNGHVVLPDTMRQTPVVAEDMAQSPQL